MPRRGLVSLVIGSLVVVVFVAGGVAGGCASNSLPPRISANELACIQHTHLAAKVGVEVDAGASVYSERLVRALRATRLFDTVEPLGQLKQPDLVARVEEHIYGTATIPILTGVSLGLIPTTVDEQWGEVFSLRRPTTPNGSIVVAWTYRGPTTLGWLAGWKNLLSDDRTFDNPRGTQRFHKAFAAAICTKAEAIEALIKNHDGGA